MWPTRIYEPNIMPVIPENEEVQISLNASSTSRTENPLVQNDVIVFSAFMLPLSTEMASSSCIQSPESYSAHYPSFYYTRHGRRRRFAPDLRNMDGPSGQRVDENSSFNDFRRNKTTIIVNRNLPTPEPTVRARPLTAHKIVPATRLAKEVANRIIKYARRHRNINEKNMCCLNCGFLPLFPVTGPCGHTRCTKCIKSTNMCPCGNFAPKKLFVNILIRDLIDRNRGKRQSSRFELVRATRDDTPGPAGILNDQCGSSQVVHGLTRRQRGARKLPSFPDGQRIPMSPRARYNHALDLVKLGRHRDAVPHLALAAAASKPDLEYAKVILAQIITVLSGNGDPRRLRKELCRMVRRVTSTSWLKPSDMECILCCEIFTNPVTTPCGHMFCRTCLERTLDYRKRCPLCLRPLTGFRLTDTINTKFVEAALMSINAIVVPPPLEPDLVPIFMCTVAFPSVPCPLFIFDPRYWLMIRRVLESGTRTFGMVACDRGQDYADYGTILEVRDCVHLEDGRSILSTVGLSRFKIIERGVRDGCEVARILPIVDVRPIDDIDVLGMKILASQIIFKAMMWLEQLNSKVKEEIESAFGKFHQLLVEGNWWESPDGPAWLWWLVAVLPLRTEIKMLILSTDCLIKRMMAVSGTLEAVELSSVTYTP